MTQAEEKKKRNIVMLPDRIADLQGDIAVVASLNLEELVKAQARYKQELTRLAAKKALIIEELQEVPTLELGLRAINQQIRHLTK